MMMTVMMNGLVNRNPDGYVFNDRVRYAFVNGEWNRLLNFNRNHFFHWGRYFFLNSLYDRLNDLEIQRK